MGCGKVLRAKAAGVVPDCIAVGRLAGLLPGFASLSLE
jgi:hypothetical protein